MVLVLEKAAEKSMEAAGLVEVQEGPCQGPEEHHSEH